MYLLLFSHVICYVHIIIYIYSQEYYNLFIYFRFAIIIMLVCIELLYIFYHYCFGKNLLIYMTRQQNYISGFLGI